MNINATLTKARGKLPLLTTMTHSEKHYGSVGGMAKNYAKSNIKVTANIISSEYQPLTSTHMNRGPYRECVLNTLSIRHHVSFTTLYDINKFAT